VALSAWVLDMPTNIHNHGCVNEELPALDLAAAVSLLGAAVDGAVLASLEGTGLRPGHGYVVQRLLVGPATATEIADELGITQQAVSKAVKELVALGHVTTVVDPEDGRRRPVTLTARGRRAVRTARATRARIDERVRAVLGEEEFAATVASLRTALDALGLGDAVRRRAVRPPSGDLG
jgi:DNA-binding MarR family transcriptional regulator